ncbi:hypothetical protein QBC34DRAFT_448335 [Podospora aff. communis PSN243]|uniref:Uncharacterized protein n=1 Tax=Podospora aff. communis PSN243 TaxID=3040156 RepID=A0AAV9GN60_9PEZI|nr:hypothetical protein QBC34DRAFT_448335 [Podospora aff. communis PSN243]
MDVGVPATLRRLPRRQVYAGCHQYSSQRPSKPEDCAGKCCKGIAEVSRRLSPYFETVNIFVSSHPEFAALVWGIFRLIFVGSFLSSLPTTALNPFHLRYDTLLNRWDEHCKIIKLEMDLLSGTSQMRTAARIDEISARIDTAVAKFSGVGMFENKDISTREAWRNLDDIRHSLQIWINAPPWLGVYENSQNQREAETTDWFVEHRVVSSWISQREVGKPGFGKTTLCAAMTEHLHRLLSVPFAPPERDENKRVALGFFFFDKQRAESISSASAWRAVVAQLLHAMPAFDQDMMDAVLAFREGKDRLAGQATASDLEIFSILRPTKTSVAVFSRPTVEPPPSIVRKMSILALEGGLNFDGIRTFLQRLILSLVDSGLLTDEDGSEETIRQIARRANGMFLWATLFVEYIQSPHLSTRARRQAMSNHNRLQGLDQLYSAILETLGQRPEDARNCTRRAFEMALYALRPLHVSELQHAVATPLGRRLEPDDLIPRFSEHIGRLSGALLELDTQGFVRFVHLSVIEYLTDGNNQEQQGLSTLSVDEHASEVSIACCCLSYLCHTVEAEPLGGCSRTPPDVELQIRKYPLINYATEYWSFHLVECMRACSEATAISHLSEAMKVVIELASQFLSRGRTLMVWIEASWMFERPPKIRHGPEDTFFSQGPPQLGRSVDVDQQLHNTLLRAWNALLQLSRDLAALNSSWGHVLEQEPSEIWEPSISAFNQSPFWERISGARIAAQFHKPHESDVQTISLKSRLSPDGKQLGLVRLHEARLNALQPFSLWEELNLEVPRSCLKRFLPLELHASFYCSVAITATLDRVAVPGCAINLTQPRANSGQQRESADIQDRTQLIDFTGNALRNGPLKLAIEDFNLAYDIQISDSGRYLMTVHKSNGTIDLPNSACSHLRFLTVYEDISIGLAPRPAYRYTGSIGFKPNYLHGDIEGDFSHRGLRVLNVCPPDLVFDDDGEYFSGIPVNPGPPGSSERQTTPGTFHRQPGIADESETTYYDATRMTPMQQVQRYNLNDQTSLAFRPHYPTLQRVGEMNSYLDESGMRVVSRLEDSGHGGIVLKTVQEDGTARAEMITRLPAQIAHDFTASIIRTDSGITDPSTRAVFLDREDRPFKMHRFPPAGQRADGMPALQLPLVLHRSQETIPIAEVQGDLEAFRTIHRQS